MRKQNTYSLPKEYTQLKFVEINGMKVFCEFVNTEKEFKWRLLTEKESSEWTGHYAGLLVHTFSNGRTFALATDYWDSVLPVEIPFEIIKAKS